MSVRISITLRLYLGFLLLSVLSLGALGTAFTYWFLGQESNALDQFLISESRSVSDRLDGIVDGLERTHQLSRTKIREELRRSLDLYMNQRLSRPIPYRTTLVVMDDLNNVLARSNTAIELESSSAHEPPLSGVPHDVFQGKASYRVISSVYAIGRPNQGTFQIACFLSSLDGPKVNFITSLIGLLAAILVLLSTLGAWLIRLTLTPVRSMAKAASLISEQNLSVRIPLPPGSDDLARMARTLNDLLGRLEADFAFQERLVGELTHQLKTPLTILRGRNELALDEATSAQALREVVEDNLSDIDGVVTLLNTLLALVRLDSRIDKLTTQPILVLDFVRSLASELEPLWMSKDLVFSCGGDEQEISADPLALRQILTNLFDNSWKYTPVGGSVLVTCALDAAKSQVVVTVKNSGPPFLPEELDLVFKRFYRSRAVTDLVPGSGLGLSIVRSLMELHGGHVSASNPPEGGAGFVLSFPLPVAASPPFSLD